MSMYFDFYLPSNIKEKSKVLKLYDLTVLFFTNYENSVEKSEREKDS